MIEYKVLNESAKAQNKKIAERGKRTLRDKKKMNTKIRYKLNVLIEQIKAL
ncbi:MAG: hypothetical protein SPK94_08205 [Bacteroidales bacterium]|nr:hypothetical protein [Bacteroidales bacterium]